MFVFSQNKRSREKVGSPHIYNRALEAMHSFGSVSSACQLCPQACFPHGDKINDSINFLTTCFLAHMQWKRGKPSPTTLEKRFEPTQITVPTPNW